MTPKKFRKIISQWRLEKYQMKMDLPNPMTEKEIETFVKRLKLKVPKKSLAFVFEFGGRFKHKFASVPDSLVPGNFSPKYNCGEFYHLPWPELLTEYQMLCKVLKSGDFDDQDVDPDDGIEPVWYSENWLPFASNDAGDFLCIDLAPAAGGQKGQVVCYLHDEKRRPVLAQSVERFFDLAADEYLNDRIYMTDEDYDLRKMRPTDFPTFK